MTGIIFALGGGFVGWQGKKKKIKKTQTHLNRMSIRNKQQSHTHPSHSQASRLLTSSVSLGVPFPRATQCIRDM
jgi:site-specific recombinase XerC